MNILLETLYNLLVFITFISFIVYLLSRSQNVIRYVIGKTKRTLGNIIVITILGTAIILASKHAIVISGARVNLRDSIAVLAAIVGGPVCGISVGIIGGIFRFFLGGWTCLPCATATILVGIVASLIVYLNKFQPTDINKKTILMWVGFNMLWEFVHLLVLVPLLGTLGVQGELSGEYFHLVTLTEGVPIKVGFMEMIDGFLLPMSIMNGFATAIFLIFIKDMVLSNTRLKLEEADRIMKTQLSMARKIQKSITPDYEQLPELKELEFGFKFIPMEQIGGDLYDYIKIDDNHYGFVIADVSGHGIPAAIIATMAKVAFHDLSSSGLSTSYICEQVNKKFCDFIGSNDHYLTAFYCILDINSGKLEYTNAGHHPAILFNKNTVHDNAREIVKLDTEGMIIGAIEDSEYGMNEILLKNGDKVLFFTDGIIEAKNNKKKEYQYEGLTSFICSNNHLAPKAFVDGLVEDVYKFCDDRPADDDISLFCFEFKANIEKLSSKNNDTILSDKIIINPGLEAQVDFTESFNYATNLIKENALEKALGIFQQLVKIQPDNLSLLNKISIVYYKLGKFKESKCSLEEALKIDNQNNRLKRNLAVINKRLKQQ